MGKIEASFRTLSNTVRCMLKHADMARNMWGQASLLLLNRLPTSTNPDFLTPFEMFYGFQPDLSKIRVWGSDCYAYADSPALGDKATQFKLIGFIVEEPHAYKLLNVETGRVLVRYNVLCNESPVLGALASQS